MLGKLHSTRDSPRFILQMFLQIFKLPLWLLRPSKTQPRWEFTNKIFREILLTLRGSWKNIFKRTLMSMWSSERLPEELVGNFLAITLATLFKLKMESRFSTRLLEWSSQHCLKDFSLLPPWTGKFLARRLWQLLAKLLTEQQVLVGAPTTR